jgi:hypothetical protein
MASFDEICERVEQRLEELLEESSRLRATLEALRGEHAPGSRGVHAGRATKPVVTTTSRESVVRPRRGYVVAPVEADAVSGDVAARDSPVERAVRQLRQELAAGLRSG